MTPLQFRIVDGIYTYWVNHTVWNSALSLAGLRWYEFNQDTSGIPFIIQQGTWFPDRLTHRWLGSLAVDRDGNMAIGYSATRTDVGGPTIRYAGRLRTEPAGTLGPLENSFATPGYTIADNLNGVSDHPWGRQSQMSIDPADECLFWYTNSYFVAPVVLNQLWATRIGAFSFPNCGGGQNVRISLHTNGTQGNKSSGMDFEMYSVGISSDGRYVVFSSDATNLVAGDVNNLRDIFLRDRDVDMDGIYDETGQVSTTLISRDPNGLPANGNSWDVAISGNSRYIAYSSEASNLLLTADTNGTADVFVYDRFLDTTTRVSVTSGGAQAIGRSDQPFLNYTGRLVVFRSTAQNLAPGPMYNGTNIFLRDRDTDLNGDFDDTGGVVTALVSTNLNTPAGSPFPAPGAASFVDCYTPTISDSDFTSSSPAASQIINIAFACRITAPIGSSSVFGAVFAVNGLNIPPTITRVPSAPAVETAYTPFISGNGRFVVFVAQSWPVTPVAGTIMRMDFPSFSFASLIRISTTFLNPLVFTANPSFSPSISRDGRFVAYASNAPDLDIFPPDLNNLRDIFLWDEETGSNQRISLDFMGGDTNDWSFAPVISGDGGHVAYVSEASDLVNNDTNNVWDVFAFNGDQVRPKFLSIPSDQVVSPGSTVSVPVNFNSQGQSIDTVTFSIDFDEVCLAFDPTDSDADDIPDAITFNVSSDFVSSVTYNAADKDGELDFAIFDWTPPVRTNLPDGTLATIQFTVKATCQAAPGSSNTARVGFSNNPPPSFGYLGQSILGSSSDGFVRITDGILGDCNGDGLVDAGDLSGLVLEIFDGDGSNPMDTVGGTFAGNPVGCNPNQDYVIDAGDLSCTILIIQGNGATCTGLASIPAKTSWFDAGIPGTVKLEIPDQVPSFLNADTVIPVNLETGGNAISSAVFSVDFDEAWLSIDPADSNHDGLPDAIELSLSQGFMASTAFDPTDQDGELDFVIYNNPMAIPKTFSDGTIAKLTMRTGSPVKPTLAFIDWASDPRPSFGSVLGTSLASLTLNGSAYIAQLPYRLFSSGILG